MLAASRLIRQSIAPTSTVFPSASSSYNILSRKTTSIKFHNKGPKESGHTQEEEEEETSEKMEKPNAEKHRGESMKSFGEGYSTRSDDEGFGGVYGGNQDQTVNEQEKKQHASSVKSHEEEFDKNQGSEVKEKEKARHQKHYQSE